MSALATSWRRSASSRTLRRISNRAQVLQDAIKVEQPGGPGKFEVPDWDQASQKTVHDALLVLGSTPSDFKGAFGAKGEVDPVRHLIGAAAAWGGNPPQGRHLSQRHAGKKMTARPSTSSTSRTCPWTASGRSPSTTPRATSNLIPIMPIRSTTSRQRRATTATGDSTSVAKAREIKYLISQVGA